MYLWQWIPLACAWVAFLTTMAVLAGWRRRISARARPQALAEELARSPGASFRGAMQDAAWDAAEYAALGFFALALLAAVYPLKWVEDGALPADAMTVAYLAVGAALLAWILRRLWRVLGRAYRLTLAYEAELAAARELEELRHLGYRVFHDVPAEELESVLDHVVVGPGGVFAVAARGRASPRTRVDGADPWEVVYDGESLQFPGWRERIPLEQASVQAEWLQEWLTGALGERVPVQPVLVLPGWRVKRTAILGIPVLAERWLRYFFERLPGDPAMDGARVERIVRALEERSRPLAESEAGADAGRPKLPA
jgi:hypothetical protein